MKSFTSGPRCPKRSRSAPQRLVPPGVALRGLADEGLGEVALEGLADAGRQAGTACGLLDLLKGTGLLNVDEGRLLKLAPLCATSRRAEPSANRFFSSAMRACVAFSTKRRVKYSGTFLLPVLS